LGPLGVGGPVVHEPISCGVVNISRYILWCCIYVTRQSIPYIPIDPYKYK
jgi:hypothetical protein